MAKSSGPLWGARAQENDAWIVRALDETPWWFEDRILARTVRLENGCLEWTGGTSGVGYGQIALPTAVVARDNGGSFVVMTHRVAWVREHGPLPAGWVLDHLCRNTRCMEVQHLEAVPFRKNVLRGHGVTARLAARSVCPAGHEYREADERGHRRCEECAANGRARRYAIQRAEHDHVLPTTFEAVTSRHRKSWVRSVFARELDPITLAELSSTGSAWAPIALDAMMVWTRRWLAKIK